MDTAKFQAISNQIAFNLKQLRTSRFYSKEDVAAEMKLAESTYIAMEEGDLADCYVETLIELAEFYKVPLTEIMPDN